MAEQTKRAHTLRIRMLHGTQTDLWRMLNPAFDAAQIAANEVMRTYFMHDPAAVLVDDKGKRTLAKIPDESTVSKRAYRAACEKAAGILAPGTVCDIQRRVRSRYMQDRWKMRVRGRQSVPTFHSPMFVPIRNAEWRPKGFSNNVARSTDENGGTIYIARFGIAGMTGENRPTIRFLPKTGRDRALLDKIADGVYQAATLELLPPGWIRQGQLRAKIVYDRPVADRACVSRTLRVSTAPDCLLIGQVFASNSEKASNDPFRWHHRQLRSRILAYEKWRTERAEDHKHERRKSESRKRIYREDVAIRAEKHHNRMRTTLQQIAHEVVGRACRHRCDTVAYDDTCRDWIAGCAQERFPWYDLKTKLGQACENAGITFTHVRKPKEAIES